MSEQPPVDPRYDPRFQRGFASPTPEVWRPAEEASPAGLVEVPRLARPAEPAERVDAAAVAPQTPDEPEPALGPNPWMIALPAVSTLMILLGGVIGYRLAEQASGITDPERWELAWRQLAWMLPTPLLTVGLLGLVATLVIPLIWKRR